MTRIRCAGCKRLCGYANVKYTGRIWCSPVCMFLPGANSNEARDDIVFLLHHLGRHRTHLAQLFGVTSSRIDQIINRKPAGGPSS